MRKTDTRLADRSNRRTHRIFHEGLNWFYLTRDGVRGPFNGKQTAIDDLARYMETVKYIESHRDHFPEGVDLTDITHIDLKPPSY